MPTRPRLTSSWAFAALFVSIPLAQAATATSLQVNPAGSSTSFWSPNNWLPGPATPGAGDDVQLGGARPAGPGFYLGDVSGGPAAQTGQISRLHVDGPNPTWWIDWGSNLVGGNHGGLTFTNDDPADPGVGIRVAWLARYMAIPNVLRLIDAETAPASPVNIAIGAPLSFLYGQPQSAASGNALALYASSPTRTLNAGSVALEGDYSTLEIFQNAELSAASLLSNGTTGSRVRVLGGALTVAHAEFLDAVGAVSVPLEVSGGGETSFDDMTVSTTAPGNESTLLVQDSSHRARLNATSLMLNASNGATTHLVVDGGRAIVGSVSSFGFAGQATDGTVDLVVVNGGELTANGTLYAGDFTTNAGGNVALTVSGAGSQFFGGLSVAANDTAASTARVRFENGGNCSDCNLQISGSSSSLELDSGAQASGLFQLGGASASFHGGASILGVTLRANASSIRVEDTAFARFFSILLSPDLTQMKITAANPAAATTSVEAGNVNVGSDFSLGASGAKFGGDRAGIAGGAFLELQNGSQLRIGDSNPFAVPMLAIGSGGQVTLDSTSSIYIGDPQATASYQGGEIVLDAGGNIYGNGLINGVGFPTGAHPDVLNTGGNLHPGFSPGTLTIDGTYTQTGGELELEIGGENAGEYDVLDAALGATFLGGTIRFERLNNFEGVLGAQLDFFAGRAVSFGPSVVIIDNTGFDLDFDLATGIATITQLVLPEPPTLSLLGAGVLGLTWIGRRRGQPSARASR